MQSPRPFERFNAVDGFADHLDIRLCFQDEPEPAAEEGLIVCDHDPDHRATVSTGSRALTAKPPFGPGPARSSPP